MEYQVIDSTTVARLLNEFLILSSLRNGKKHGYQLTLEIEEHSDGYFQLAFGTLYPILHKLESDGLIIREEDNIGGRHRKIYCLSENGLAYINTLIERWNEFITHISEISMGKGENI